MYSAFRRPEFDQSASNEFYDKVPLRLDGHGDFASYIEDVMLWISLTTLQATEHGPAVVGPLRGSENRREDTCNQGPLHRNRR